MNNAPDLQSPPEKALLSASKKSLSVRDFACYDDPAYKSSSPNGKTQDRNTDAANMISIFNFELQMYQYGTGEPAQAPQDLQADSQKLIKQLKTLGIDVFEYTDMQNHDRHLNIKVRDVIQIYRIFDNLRDSKDDGFDEVKLYKLQHFPFFSPQEYEGLEKIASQQYQKPKKAAKIKKEEPCNIEGSNRGEGCLYGCQEVSGPVQQKQVHKDLKGSKEDQELQEAYQSSPSKKEGSSSKKPKTVEENEPKLHHRQRRPMDVSTQIEAGGISSTFSCARLLCNNERDTDMYQVAVLEGPARGRILRVHFRDFFRIMATKLKESKRLKSDIVFEDKERNVSCFFW